MIITKEDAAYIAEEIKKPFQAARQLSEKESLSYDKWTPTNWHIRQPIIPPREVPQSSGLGYTQSPYISQWTKMWGVNPLADLGKYRLMYRTVPVIKRGIDKTVNTAISKGFKLDLPEGVENRDEILTSVSNWIAGQWNWKNTLSMIASDMLVYGSAFCEIVYDESETEMEEQKDPELAQYTIPDPEENFKLNDSHIPVLENKVISNNNGRYMLVGARGKPMWLKPLDPLWMRVRRDSYGNMFGAIQFLSVPPVAFTPAKILIARFSQKSWWTENAYGVSFLQSIIRTQDAIWQLENDLILISHACAKPPLIFSCGTEDSPWTEPQFTSFVGDVGGRGPGGDVFHRGDVDSKPLPFPASSLAPLLAHLDYHNEQRIIAMGVPPDLLGIGGMGKGAATVAFDDWINTIQQLQEQLADAIEEQLFKHIVEAEFGEDTPVPRIIWNPIYEKDTTAEVQKIIALKNSQIITTNEARTWTEELGKKLSPLEGGDVLGTPQVLPPDTEQVDEKVGDMGGDETNVDNLEEDQEIVNDTVESGAFESSFKSEYTDVDIMPPFLYDPESTESLKEEEFEKKAWHEEDYPWHKIEAPYKPDEKKASDRYKELIPKKADDIPNSLMYPELGPRKAGEGVGEIDEGREPNIGPEGKGRTEFPNQPPRKWPASEEDPRIEKFVSINGVNVFKVSGDKVHDTLDKQWKNTSENTEHDYIGGHHFVFSYIPENEIWVSDLDDKTDKTIIHEFVERHLMKERKMDYDEAHAIAKMVEEKGIDEIKKINLYISPREAEEKITSMIDWTKTDNIWRDKKGNKILFDRAKGEVLLYNNKGDLLKKSLIRNSEDIERFLNDI